MARRKAAKKAQEPILLKVTSAFVFEGEVVRKNDLLETTDSEARRLLARGKVSLATDEDVKPAGKSDNQAQNPQKGGDNGKQGQSPQKGGEKG